MEESILAIVPAAGKPTNKILANSNLPDAMTPINGKPVIGYIIEDLLERKIKSVTVILNKSDQSTEKYLLKKYKKKIELHIIFNDELVRGLGYSIYLAITQSPQADSYLVYLGDTIYKGDLNFTENFLITSSVYEQSNKWCFVEQRGKNCMFIDKPEEYSGQGKILCGIYYFANGRSLRQILNRLGGKKMNFEMKDLLQKYGKSSNFQLREADHWYDCGNIENYYKAKIDFLKLRNFNHIDYNELYGYITKTSNNKQKIMDEINWYINIPEELKIFSPRLVNHSTNKNSASYAIEYYGYPTLADLFVFESLDIAVWKIIICRLFEIIATFQQKKAKIPDSFYYKMYYEKTVDRLLALRKDKYWEQVLSKKHVIINGKNYKNFDVLVEKLEKHVKTLINNREMSFIHGDLCLGNILFDYSSKLFKFIDPRGSFGITSIYGDIKYDVAKLRHSFCGYYDFIVGDLFEVQEDKNSFDFKVYVDDNNKHVSTLFDTQIEKIGFNITKIQLIESLLFLSMIPLHNDNVLRQKAMYLTGIKLLNEVL